MRNIAKRESVWTPLGYRDRQHVSMFDPEDQSPQRSRDIQQEEALPVDPNHHHITRNILTITESEEVGYTGLEVGGDELLRDSTSESEMIIGTGGSTSGEFRSDLDTGPEMERDTNEYSILFHQRGPVSSEEEMVLDHEMSRDC